MWRVQEPRHLQLLSDLEENSVFTMTTGKKVHNAPTEYQFCIKVTKETRMIFLTANINLKKNPLVWIYYLLHLALGSIPIKHVVELVFREEFNWITHVFITWWFHNSLLRAHQS